MSFGTQPDQTSSGWLWYRMAFTLHVNVTRLTLVHVTRGVSRQLARLTLTSHVTRLTSVSGHVYVPR
jgi:predicted GNAT superfamily acetyltransferase